MINTLDDYIYRSLPEQGDFHTNPALEKKVDREGRFLPFYGDTVVFTLAESTKRELSLLQDELYTAVRPFLAQPLSPDTFHMTLHDLNNSPQTSPALDAAMEESCAAVKPMMELWRSMPPLKMRSSWLFNMVNTSIVLGLVPADEDSRQRLDSMYTALEQVVPLGYALCPHITMAYYRPGCLWGDDLAAMRAALRPVELSLEFDMSKLFYQRFTHMNSYTNFSTFTEGQS